MTGVSYKSFPCTFKVLDAEQGVVEAIVSVYGVKDTHDERMVFGCYANSLKADLPGVCWSHDWNRPIGKTIAAREIGPGDAMLPPEIATFGGLYVKGQFNLATQDGREMFSNIAFGAIKQFSVGYADLAHELASDGITDVTDVKLYEWSPVLVGSNPATAVISVKEMPQENQNKGVAFFERKSVAQHAAPSLKTIEAITKGEFLGDGVDTDAAYGFMYNLTNSLVWGIYSMLCNIETLGVAEVQRQIEGSFTEAGKKMSTLCGGLFAGEDMEPEVMKKAMEKYFPSDIENFTLSVDGNFEKALATVADANASMLERAEKRLALRKKEGRTFSAEVAATITKWGTDAKALGQAAHDMIGYKEAVTTDVLNTDGSEKSIDQEFQTKASEEFAAAMALIATFESK